MTIVTIDPADARDFDDAISLEPLDGGHWRLGVHIADVAHFVRPRGALDREARAAPPASTCPTASSPCCRRSFPTAWRASSRARCVTRLRRCWNSPPRGCRVDAEFHRAAIRSSKRLTYEQVDAFLAEPAAWRRKLGAKVHALLGDMHSLAMTLRRRRLKQRLPGTRHARGQGGPGRRGPGGRRADGGQHREPPGHRGVHAGGQRGGRPDALRDRGVPFLRRIHQSPSPAKIKVLGEFVRELGLPAGNLRSRFDLQKLLREVTGRPEQRAVHFAVLRSLQRAVYSPEEEGHYALASDCYCHFTSPIRRYPDLTVHRLLGELLPAASPAATSTNWSCSASTAPTASSGPKPPNAN